MGASMKDAFFVLTTTMDLRITKELTRSVPRLAFFFHSRPIPPPQNYLILFQSYFTLLLALLIVSSVLAAAQGTKLVKVRR